ncbi:DUF5996 family protein, partial [Blastococcus sp. SYSU D00669]
MTATTAARWPAVPYERWAATCDTLHAHAQVLGKIATALAPPEPQLQHAAMRLTVRGWETAPLPAPDGSGALALVLDMRRHEVAVEHSSGWSEHVPLTPHRAVRDVTREVLASVARICGPVAINPEPQEVPWQVPLDEDREHARYEPEAVHGYFAAAGRAAQVLTEFRAPFRGRSTPVAAWWGSFDLAVGLFSGRAVDPPADDFITRNSADAQMVAVGWWPGDPRYPRAAFYGYAHPPVEGLRQADLSPPQARWEPDLGEFVLDWDDVRAAPDPSACALRFARSLVRRAGALAGWDEALIASVDGRPSPLRPRRGGD